MQEHATNLTAKLTTQGEQNSSSLVERNARKEHFKMREQLPTLALAKTSVCETRIQKWFRNVQSSIIAFFRHY